MHWFLFVFYALFACGGALAVVLSQNIVRMAFYLVVSLGATAALFFLLDADFVGATQLLIYVGGTVVLLIFGVMLTSSSPLSSIKNTPAEILQGAVVGLAFLTLLISTVLSVKWATVPEMAAHTGVDNPAVSTSQGFNPVQEGNTSRSIGSALLGMRFDRDLAQPGSSVEMSNDPVSAPGSDEQLPVEHSHSAQGSAASESLSTGYLLPFEIISIHLLVVLIGASYLARAKRSDAASPA